MNATIESLSSTRTLAKGIFWNGLGRGLPIIVAIVVTPFILHRLGVDRWALFTLALSIAGSFGVLDFGVSAALTRALAERIGTPEERDAGPLIVAAMVVLAATSTAGAVAGYFLTPAVIDHMLNVPPDLRTEAIVAFRLLSVSAPLIIINAALWGVISAYQSFRLATLFNIPISAMYYLGPMLAVLIRDSLIEVIAALIVTRLMQASVSASIVVRLVPDLKRHWRFEPHLLRPIIRIGAWITVSNTLWPVMLYLDRFIVGAMLPLAALSYYTTPLDLVMRLFMIPVAISTVLYPAVATSYRTMPERKRSLLRSGTLVIVLTTFPPCLLMASLSYQLLSVWLGAGFALESQSILTVFSVGMFLNCISILPGTLTDAIGRPDVGATIMICQALLFPPLIILLTARYGTEGAAVAWTLRACVNCAARLLACRTLSASAAPAVRDVFVVTSVATLALVVNPMIIWMPARIAVTAFATVAITALAIVTLLDRGKIPQIWRAVQSYLPLRRPRPDNVT